LRYLRYLFISSIRHEGNLMNASAIISRAAADHAIDASTLEAYFAKSGWDFSVFTGRDDEVAFLEKLATHHAAEIAARRAAIETASAQAAAMRDASLTKAARANPSLQCQKCDGTGRIRAFSHIEDGSCFQCSGTGVRRPRR
jgi:hypothetical protein